MSNRISNFMLIVGWCAVATGSYLIWGLGPALVVGGVALMFARGESQ